MQIVNFLNAYKPELIAGMIGTVGGAVRRVIKLKKLPQDEFVNMSIGKKVGLVARDAAIGGSAAAGATFGIKKGWGVFSKWAEKNEWARLTERWHQGLGKDITIEKSTRWTTTRVKDEVAGVHSNGQQMIYSRLDDKTFRETVHIPKRKGFSEITSTVGYDDVPSDARAMFLRGH